MEKVDVSLIMETYKKLCQEEWAATPNVQLRDRYADAIAAKDAVMDLIDAIKAYDEARKSYNDASFSLGLVMQREARKQMERAQRRYRECLNGIGSND